MNSEKSAHHLPKLPLASGSAEAVDPVCHMTVNPHSAAASMQHEGKTYYFCCTSCLEKFRINPARYLTGGEEPEVRVGAKYTCPMHPEVVRDHPASCPKCGMALEPMGVPIEQGPSDEYLDMRRRFWIGAALSLPVVVMAMSEMLPGKPLHVVDMAVLNWAQFVLTTPVVFWCGWPFFQRGWASVRNRSPNMFTLIALGVGAAYLYSVVATVAPAAFPQGFRTAAGSVEAYFDTAGVVTVLILLGQVLEIRARGQTGAAIQQLMGLAPKTARVVRADGQEEDIGLDALGVGDLIRIRPGEKVPADGVVTEGRSAIDESMISGEPIPVEKEAGSKVTSGTINGTGSLLIRAEHVGSETLLAQIVRMVAEAQRSRAPIERLVNRVARYFVPAVLIVSVLSFVAWSLWGTPPRMAHGLVSAVAVLIIACPCALGLATPLSIMVGIGRGAEQGVLVKDAASLEGLEKADTLLVDKTGTLTEGKPKVAAIEPMSSFTSDEVLRVAAALERSSEHPLAGAVVDEAKRLGVPAVHADEFQSVTGLGVTGVVEGRRVVLGNIQLLRQEGLAVESIQHRVEELRRGGHTVMIMAIDGQLSGLLSVVDPIRASTLAATQSLRGDGLRIVMVTGDSRTTAETVARSLSIDEVIAEVLPQEKHEVVKRLQAEGHVVAMAGDGINDAPALAQAHIGIALGSGTDVAMSSAGITLVQGDLRGIVRARLLSRATIANIRQNLFLAFVYNVLSIPVAAGVLYPLFGILISPIWASVAMSLSSLSVIGNALRLRQMRF